MSIIISTAHGMDRVKLEEITGELLGDISYLTDGIFKENLRSYLRWWREIIVDEGNITIIFSRNKNLNHVLLHLNQVMDECFGDWTLLTSKDKNIYPKRFKIMDINISLMNAILSGIVLKREISNKENPKVIFQFGK